MSVDELRAKLLTLLTSPPPADREPDERRDWTEALLSLLQSATTQHPDHLESVFHAEMMRSPALWEDAVVVVESVPDLERAAALLPFAGVTYAPESGLEEEEEARALTASPAAVHVAALYLSEASPAALAVLAASPALCSLQRLDLIEVPGAPAVLRAMTGAARWPALRHLVLSYTHLDAEALSLLSQWPHIQQLEQLTMDNCSLTPEALAAFRGTTALEVLNLEANSLTDRGVAALAANPDLARLHTLYLSGDAFGGTNDLTDEALTILADAPVFSGLRALLVEGNAIGSDGVRALAASSHLRSLEVLGLGSNEIDDAGVAALAQSPVLQAVWALNLGHNPLSDAAAAALAKSPYLSQLRTLRLIWTDVSEEGAEQLRNAERLPSLVTVEQGSRWYSGEAATRRWPD